MNNLIVIVGPTAIGKTDLSIHLAKYLNTEIISCDSRQFYKELKIGAAPPNIDQLKNVKHHFIHHKSIKENYNAGLFEIDAIKKISKLFKSNNHLVAVGGSGLYIDALCKGFNQMPNISEKTRSTVNNNFNENGLSWLQQKVKIIDPVFYKNCDHNNHRRLLRALEIYETTGEKISNIRKNKIKKRPFKVTKIGLEIERDLLYNRINIRVDKMIESGLINEVKSLLPFNNHNALKTVGYEEIFAFYSGEHNIDESIKLIKRNTRRLAKRQLTWFKKDKKIKWFNPKKRQDIVNFISKL